MAIKIKKYMFTGERGQLARVISSQLETDSTVRVVEAHDGLKTRVAGVHPWPELDIRNYDQVLQAFQSATPDVVIHSGAIVNTDKCSADEKTAIDVNLLGTANVLKACGEIGAKLLYFSTTATYDPSEPRPFREAFTRQRAPTLYGITKLAGEMLVTGQTRVPHMVVRPCFVYGDSPYDHSSQLVRVAVHQALTMIWPEKAGSTPQVTLDPESLKDYMRVEDFAAAVVKILELDSWRGDVFNVSASSARPMREYFEQLAKCFMVPCEELDMEWIPEADYMSDHVVSSEKLRACTGWEPSIRWRNGVEMTAKSAVQYVRDCRDGRAELLYR